MMWTGLHIEPRGLLARVPAPFLSVELIKHRLRLDKLRFLKLLDGRGAQVPNHLGHALAGDGQRGETVGVHGFMAWQRS